MFGKRLVHAFEEVKDRFDPNGLFNPGKIVRAPKFDDRTQFPLRPGLSRRADRRRGSTGRPIRARAAVSRARSRCATTTAPAASSAGGVMCPCYRVTRDERDVTRGRANSLRLAITGQLGPDALTSDEMAETMKLCVSCKACRRECPTGVDMARMKIEVQAARAAKYGLVAARPAGRLAAALRALCGEAAVAVQSARRDAGRGASCRRRSPASARGARCRSGGRICSTTRSDCAARGARHAGKAGEPSEVVLFADTFNRYFERENLDAALAVLRAGRLSRCMSRSRPTDRRARSAAAARSSRSARSTRRGARPSARSRRSRPSSRAACRSIGLEPSCILGFRDEIPAMIKSEARAAARRARADCSRNFWRARRRPGRLKLPLEADRRARAAARPLPSEGVRRVGRGRDRAASSCPSSKVETDRIELLRHGRRLRLRRRHHRRVAGDGRAVAAAGGAQGRRRHAHRRRRHLLPPSDPRRHRPRGAACRARAGDEFQ